MTDIVFSPRYGGFGLSDEAMQELGLDYSESQSIRRDDPELVRLVREWGPERTSSRFAWLTVATIPDDVQWHIAEYDGNEWIAEDHRCWGPDGEWKAS